MAAAITTTVLRRSKGAVVRKGDLVGVLYSGNLNDANKTPFDANYDFSTFSLVPGRQLFTFTLGSGSVIAGWEQGLNGRRLGEVVELTIPSELAYGSAGSPPVIPPDAALQFKVELVGAIPAGKEAAVYPDYKDLGLSRKAINLIEASTIEAVSRKLGTVLDDNINGGNNSDLLIGFAGNDALNGGASADLLIAGGDSNLYVYTSASDSVAARNKQDQIIEFNPRRDKIDLSPIGDNLTFIGKQKFSNTAGEVRFTPGHLQLDSNGDGKAELEILLLGTSRLTSNNLIL